MRSGSGADPLDPGELLVIGGERPGQSTADPEGKVKCSTAVEPAAHKAKHPLLCWLFVWEAGLWQPALGKFFLDQCHDRAH